VARARFEPQSPIVEHVEGPGITFLSPRDLPSPTGELELDLDLWGFDTLSD
jgi:hypothetical protein